METEIRAFSFCPWAAYHLLTGLLMVNPAIKQYKNTLVININININDSRVNNSILATHHVYIINKME